MMLALIYLGVILLNLLIAGFLTRCLFGLMGATDDDAFQASLFLVIAIAFCYFVYLVVSANPLGITLNG